jgi:hypothetical protein
VTKREEAKDLYLAALRGDVAAQRKCTANGKPCGGRCIPKNWNCRIRGEGDTPPTRGNEVQLSGAQKERLRGLRTRRRRNQTIRVLAGAAGVAGAAVGAGYLASKNPQATRRVANRMGVMSNIAGMASNLPGPTGAAAGVVNMGVGAFQAGANMGASLAQNQRGRTRLRQLKGVLAQTQIASRRMGESIGKLKSKREVYERERSSLMTRMGTQGGTTAQRRSLRSLDTTLNRLTRQIQEKETARSVTTRRIASITKATRNIEGLLTGNYNTAEKVVRTIEQRAKDFRSGRRQTSNLRPQRRRGPKPDRRSWQERFGLDAEEQRADKKCGSSAIEESKKCHKGSGEGRQVAKAAATAALVAGGAVALRHASKASLGKTQATLVPKGPWVASKGRRMTVKEVEALRRMREKGQGKYGAQPRRRTGDAVEHHGETFSDYNKPKRTPNHPTKSHAVLAREGGDVKLIRFGQQGVEGSPPKQGESKAYASRRRAWKARHASNIAKGKMSAAYWANQAKW